MNKEKIINILESDNELSRTGIHYPLTQKIVYSNVLNDVIACIKNN